ncbi:MAG: hypothetical protein WBH56_01775 [Bacteroidota bacterium]
MIAVGTSHAQYIIQQVEYDLPISYELIPEDVEFESEEDEVAFFLNLPTDKLRKAALSEGRELREENTTIYIDGGNIAVESMSDEMGRTTLVSNTNTGVLYYVIWSQKKVFEMKPGDTEKMREKALENLPPEMREEARAEMEREKTKKPSQYSARPTGRKMNLYGFDCEQYVVNTDEAMLSIWAAKDQSGVVGEVNRVSRKFDELFQTDEDEDVDEWDLVPGKIPVEVRRYSGVVMMEEPALRIQAITKIEKKTPSADKFSVPGVDQGFRRGSMMEMMMQMAPDESE